MAINAAPVQGKTGTTPFLSVGNVTVTLDVVPVAGRTLVAVLSVDKNAGTISTPAGWTLLGSYSGTSVSGAVFFRQTDGTVRSVTLTWAAADRAAAYGLFEFAMGSPAVAASTTLPSPSNDTAVASISGNAGTAAAPGLLVAVLGIDTSYNFAGTSNLAGKPTWSGATERFTTAYVDIAASNSSGGAGFSLATQPLANTNATSVTASWTTSDQAWLTIGRLTGTEITTVASPFSYWDGVTSAPVALEGFWNGFSMETVVFENHDAPVDAVEGWESAARATHSELNKFSYTGAWSSGVADHYTSTAGASADVKISGTQFQLYGTRDVHHGEARVFVDGVAVATVDLYASARAERSLLHESVVMTDKEHLVQLVALGTRTASSTGVNVGVSEILVKGIVLDASSPATSDLLWETDFQQADPRASLHLSSTDDGSPSNLSFPTGLAYASTANGKAMRVELDGSSTVGWRGLSWLRRPAGAIGAADELGIEPRSEIYIEQAEYITQGMYDAINTVDVKTGGVGGVAPGQTDIKQMSDDGVLIPGSFSSRIFYRRGSNASVGYVWLDAYFYAIHGNGVFQASNPLYGTGTKHGITKMWRHGLTGTPVRVPVGRTFRLGTYVKLNTPGRSDGVLRHYFDGELVVDLSDVQWRGADHNTLINAMTLGSRYSVANTAPTRYIDHTRITLRAGAPIPVVVEPPAEEPPVGEEPPSTELIRNPGFTVGTSSWTADANTVIAREASIVPSGSTGAMRLTSATAGNITAHSERFAVDPKKSYTFTSQVRAVSTPRSTGLQVDWWTRATPAGDNTDYISSSYHYVASTTTYAGRTVGPISPPATATHASLVHVVNSTAAAGEAHLVGKFTARAATVVVPPESSKMLINEQFATNHTISNTNRDSDPIWFIENGWQNVTVSGGIARISNSGDWHRIFSKFRIGGPGKKLMLKYRARLTRIGDWTGSAPGMNLGLKFPVASNVTGYSEEDPRSVYGHGDDPRTPASIIFRAGLNKNGYMEVARNSYGNGYLSFPSSKSVGYTLNSWRDISILFEWLPNEVMRARYWHNNAATGTPVYDWQAQTPFNEPAFLWIRTDDADWECEYITVEDVT